MAQKKPDVLQIVDAAYRIDDPGDTWLVGLAETARPLLDAGFGICAFEFRPGSAADSPPEIAQSQMLGVPPDLAALHGTIFRTMDPEIRKRPFRMGPCVSGSQLMGGGAAIRDNPHMQLYAQKFGMYDSIWITAAEPSGWGCGFHAGRAKIASVPRVVAQRWAHIAAHLSAAARLRQKLRALKSIGPLPVGDAILDRRGKIHDATGTAREKSALAELRRSVLTLEKIRGPLRRSEPDRALSDWKALVMGRWSLLDQMESDGRRYIVARENEPAASGPETLTVRERQVIGYAKLGHHNKLIAYELGISHSTVRVLLARAARRLQVRTRAELIDACAPRTDPRIEERVGA
jgi:DNA-binding CsgD family transcriptional regulator